MGKKIFYCQPGMQTALMECTADIIIIGGAMGCGKTENVIIRGLVTTLNCKFANPTIFRKTLVDIYGPGGVWMQTQDALDRHNIRYETNQKHNFLTLIDYNRRINFSGYKFKEKKKAEMDTSGARATQIPHIFVDEADTLTYDQFHILRLRNRSAKTTIKPCLVLACNPNDGWIKILVTPFLTEDLYPDHEECKKIKYVSFLSNIPIIYDTKEDFITNLDYGEKELESLQTLAFLPGSIDENKILLKNDPGYLTKLQALPEHLRLRYLKGWWGSLPKDGVFNEATFNYYTITLQNIEMYGIFIDTASGTQTKNDFTAATCWAFKQNKIFLIGMLHGRWDFVAMAAHIESFIREYCIGGNPQNDVVYIESASAGRPLFSVLKNNLQDINTIFNLRMMHRGNKSKLTRAQEALGYLNNLMVFLPNYDDSTKKMSDKFLNEVLSFSADLTHNHDDITDTFIDAVNVFGPIVRRRPNIKPSDTKYVEPKSKLHRIATINGVQNAA